MKKLISLIDFGAGNLHSIYKALKFTGADAEITKDISVIEKSDVVIFPGVGAFGAVMSAIKKNNLQDVIIKSAKSSKPFLGICVGMQVLFNSSEESPKEKGLGVFKGKVIRFKKAKIVPHIGWNDSNGKKYYFIHSYHVVPEDKSIIYGETEYDGEKFTSIIKRDNLLAVQFHPEKSGDIGLRLLKDFLKIS